MAVGNDRFRTRPAPRGPRRAVVVLAGAAVLSVTFVLGVLVGRGSSPLPPLLARPEKSTRSASAVPGRDRGLQAGRVSQLEEKLTFYQTLTAPPSAPRTDGSGPAAGPPESPGPAAAPAGREKAPGGGNASDLVAASDGQRSARTGGPAAAGGPETSSVSPGRPRWTVQAGAYRTRDLAEELARSLRAAGYDAYVTAVAFEDGRVHHRVRVGSFPDRSEAERAAERLRSERSLVPFVTQK